jgi:hypothetical protein
MTYLVAAIACALLLLAAPAIAIDPSLECHPQAATAGGQAWTCPLGGIRNVVDIEGGTYVKGEPNKLNLNIGAGAGRVDRAANGHVVINPDIGRCTIIEQGVVAPYKRIAVFCPRKNREPIIRLYGQVIVQGSLKVRR